MSVIAGPAPLPGLSLARALDEHICRLPFASRNDGDGWLHPHEGSVAITNEHGEREVLGGCARATWYRAKGNFTHVAPDPNSNTYVLWTTHHGHQIEEMLTEMCKQMGIWRGNSIPFENAQYKVRGEMDLLIQEPGFDKPTLCEVKSAWGYMATKSILGSKRPPMRGKPKDQHLLQASIYFYLHRDKVARAKIFYFFRDSSKHTEFNLSFLEREGRTYILIDGIPERRFCMEDILARMEEVRGYLEMDQPPARDFTLEWSDNRVELERHRGNVSKSAYEEWKKGKRRLGNWECGYCPYASICWETAGDEESLRRFDGIGEEEGS